MHDALLEVDEKLRSVEAKMPPGLEVLAAEINGEASMDVLEETYKCAHIQASLHSGASCTGRVACHATSTFCASHSSAQ